MKSLNIVFACSVFILTAVVPACKKNKDSQLSVTANAGQDRGIVLPKDSVMLNGSAVSVGGSIASYQTKRA